jgi:hypothetical protein
MLEELERPIMDALGYANQRGGAQLIYGGDTIVRDPVNDRVTVSGHAWARRGEMILDGQLDPNTSLVIEQSSNIILSTKGTFTRSQLIDPKALE